MSVSDDGKCFKGGLGQPGRAGLLTDQRADPRRIIDLGDKLPGARNADESIASLGLLVMGRQLLQFLFDSKRN